ncbi:hypothetical protein [Amycolatopsis sp. NPDC058986]|uniref:hypothetical protein n=1 Tax=unclassified Amycolatopsis TaxID=2618356 RepID=UPI00366FE28F
MLVTTSQLSHRDRAILKAVAAGRAELSCSCEPDLFVDGLSCCDQAAARALTHAGYIAPCMSSTAGRRVPAQITAAGTAALAVSA